MGKWFAKGSRVLLDGRIQTNSYEDKNGNKVNAVDVIVENVEFADSKKKDAFDGQNVPNEDIPF